ncbi:succinate--CoA ligase subunit alpha, partial [Mesorhizobium sp. M2C.T.Ca.TU.009.01.2.1]
MSILIGRTTGIVVSGIGSSMVLRQCNEMKACGTKLVGAVGCGQVPHEDNIDVYTDFRSAIMAGAEVALFFNDPFDVKQRMLEAIAAGIKMVICLTEFVPVHDALEIREAANRAGTMLIGPNSSGVLSALQSKAGYFSDEICMPGSVGIVTKGGSIAYGVLSEMKCEGLGISTIVSVGPDPVKGVGYADLLPLFEKDPQTRIVVLLGEIGGRDEEDAAAVIASQMTKPVLAYTSGKYVEDGQSFGHAGAIIRNGIGGYASKVDAFR